MARQRKGVPLNKELLKQNFEAHGFIVRFFDTADDAAAYLTRRLAGQTVGFGDSETLISMKMYERLTAAGCTVWFHKVPDHPADVLIRARDASWYLLSANGISETGEIVNIDGNGNRLTSTTFGKKTVFFVAGRNKVVPTMYDAIDRAENTARPLNAKKYLGADAPREALEARMERMDRAVLILKKPVYGMKAELLLIDEDLGF